jgi:hypothetical protein
MENAQNDSESEGLIGSGWGGRHHRHVSEAAMNPENAVAQSSNKNAYSTGASLTDRCEL